MKSFKKDFLNLEMLKICIIFIKKQQNGRVEFFLMKNWK